jgi:PAS domain S-box-containing protein
MMTITLTPPLDESRLRRLVESGVVKIGFGAQDGRLTHANGALLRFLGHSEDDLAAGRVNWRDLAAPDDRAVTDAAVADMRRDGACRPFGAELALPRGRLPVQIRLALLDPADRDGDLVMTVTDISGQKSAERALADRTAELRRLNTRLLQEMRRREAVQDTLLQSQKLEALGQLTAGIAHDFNNLLGAMAGAFELVKRRTTDPSLLAIVGSGNSAAWRGAALVKKLMAFARQRTLSPDQIDVAALLEEAVPLIHQTVGIRVEVELACGDERLPVHVDPSELEAALINLCANARDAMEQGGRLTIRAAAAPAGAPAHPAELAGQDAVAISIADTGSGMSPEILQRVLEPFFTTKGPGRGTGLGLAMVRGFVSQSGGALRIASRLGVGTEITIFLPRSVELVAAGAAVAPAATQPEPRPDVGTTVLLVDDDGQMRDVTAAHLRDLGYRVLEATDGAMALVIALRPGQRVDIVLCDVVMPGLDGPTFAADLRRHRPTLPVLFMTGHADRGRLDGEAVIDKPFMPGELATRLAGMLAATAIGADKRDDGLDRLAARLRAAGLAALLRRWRSLRQGDRLPRLADFNLDADDQVGHLAIVAVDMGRVPMTFRLDRVGAALERAAGQPLSGGHLAVVGDDALGSIEAAYRRCAKSRKPTYEYARYDLGDAAPTLFERLVLPFAEDGLSVDHLVAAVMIDRLDTENVEGISAPP